MPVSDREASVARQRRLGRFSLAQCINKAAPVWFFSKIITLWQIFQACRKTKDVFCVISISIAEKLWSLENKTAVLHCKILRACGWQDRLETQDQIQIPLRFFQNIFEIQRYNFLGLQCLYVCLDVFVWQWWNVKWNVWLMSLTGSCSSNLCCLLPIQQ